ncbi:MAG: hypothetical protein QW738_08690 [Nitrososphaeria archaeon]
MSNNIKLALTSMFSALVILFDYSLKFFQLKIPFFWFTVLKFDFTGVPIVLSYFFVGLSSSAIVSFIAFLAIVLRSGNIVSAFAKGIAEFSTILGIWLAYKLSLKSMIYNYIFAIFSRCLVMFFVNLLILPFIMFMPFESVIQMLPIITIFNIIQGSISVLIGYIIYTKLQGFPPIKRLKFSL